MEVPPLVKTMAQLLSIVSFAFYGTGCLLPGKMVSEFERFGLARFRRLTGTLQLAGSIGLVAGFFSHALLIFSAGGLALLMLLGVIVRVRLRDPLIAIVPAAFYFFLNLFLVVSALWCPTPFPGALRP